MFIKKNSSIFVKKLKICEAGPGSVWIEVRLTPYLEISINSPGSPDTGIEEVSLTYFLKKSTKNILLFKTFLVTLQQFFDSHIFILKALNKRG